MNNTERSDFIFKLAERFGFAVSSNNPILSTEDEFERFKIEYAAQSKIRDSALLTHLANRPDRLRAFVPYTPRIFSLASQVIWYLDELVIPDPISLCLFNSPADDISREQLQSLLKRLNLFRPSIENGYLLLAGPDVCPLPGTRSLLDTSTVLQNPEIVKALDQSVRFGLDKRKGEHETEWFFYGIHLDYAMSFGIIPSGIINQSTTSPSFRIDELFPEVSAPDLDKVLRERSAIEIARTLYAEEISSIIWHIHNTSKLNSAIMFDRQVDAIVANAAGMPRTDHFQQQASVGAFNLSLPYIEGIPPEKLVDLRNQMPNAFLDFRARIVDIVYRASREDPENASAVARLAADREILPALNSLESELAAVAKQTRILGYGLAATAALAGFAGAFCGAGWPAFLTGAATASTAAITSFATSTSSSNKLKAYPFYFLWRAHKK